MVNFTGLYNLAQSLHGIPSGKITLFTLPSFPRAEVVPADTANVLWTQPEDSEIFASFRAAGPAGSSLFTVAVPQRAATVGRPGKFGVSPSASPPAPSSGPPAQVAGRTASQNICVS